MNLMMEVDALCPSGSQQATHEELPEGHCIPAPMTSRADRPVRYHYTNFGLSVHFPPGVQPRTVTGIDSRQRDTPELSRDVPYDPYKVDIFCLGTLFKK